MAAVKDLRGKKGGFNIFPSSWRSRCTKTHTKEIMKRKMLRFRRMERSEMSGRVSLTRNISFTFKELRNSLWDGNLWARELKITARWNLWRVLMFVCCSLFKNSRILCFIVMKNRKLSTSVIRDLCEAIREPRVLVSCNTYNSWLPFRGREITSTEAHFTTIIFHVVSLIIWSGFESDLNLLH